MIKLSIGQNPRELSIFTLPVEGVEQDSKAVITYLSDTKLNVKIDKHEMLCIEWFGNLYSTCAPEVLIDLDVGVMTVVVTGKQIKLERLQCVS